MQRALISLMLLAWIAATPLTAAAVTELSGFSAGAYFKILVPDGEDPVAWNGSLVIWNHGFSMSPIGPVGDMGPLKDTQLAQGYAVAASSYRQIGWAVFKTNNDLREMLHVFKANFGAPDEIIVTGGSLGGIVTAAALEKGNLGNVTGAVSVCGALAGSRNWDAGTDIRLIYDVICADVPGAYIPGGAEGLPAGSSFSTLDLLTATSACFGFPTPSPNPGAAERLGHFLSATQIPIEFLLTDVGYATFSLADLVHDPAKLNGKIGVTTVGVNYADPVVDAEIERVSPNPGAANRLGRNYTPEGSVGDAKIVSIHTDLDGLVLVENESEYASVVPAANLTTAIVTESAPTHCGFTDAEGAAAWEALRGWIAGAPQPSAADIQATCEFLEAFGLADGPCRYDPGYAIPDMDGRVPPR